jgi:hypothetical protein
MHNMIPPKFTPSIFEEVGRALGPSLLDLTNSNPRSRIPNSEYRSLQGLRNALRNEINRNQSKARVSKVRHFDDFLNYVEKMDAVVCLTFEKKTRLSYAVV